MTLTMSYFMPRALASLSHAFAVPITAENNSAYWVVRQWKAACQPIARSERVMLLIAAIVMMCLGDLTMTMDHARTIGLFEANPLAREVMRSHSPEVLLTFKCASIILGCSLLGFLRKTRIAELGSWAALFAMTLLCIHWNGYSQGLSEMTSQYAAMASGAFPCDTWVYWGP